MSQRALQANASQFLGHTEIGGAGFVVAELSPYEVDLDWEDLTEPDQLRPVMVQLGKATAKLHCVGDADSDHGLVPFQTEEAITAMIGGRRAEFVADLVTFAHDYARQTQDDHRRFVDAFRAGAITGISPSGDHPPGDVPDHPEVRADPRFVEGLGDDGEAHPLVEAGRGDPRVAPDEVAAAGGDPGQPVDDQRPAGAAAADRGVGRHAAQLPGCARRPAARGRARGRSGRPRRSRRLRCVRRGGRSPGPRRRPT